MYERPITYMFFFFFDRKSSRTRGLDTIFGYEKTVYRIAFNDNIWSRNDLLKHRILLQLYKFVHHTSVVQLHIQYITLVLAVLFFFF